jgi:DNA-binding CsgD family transcriptional regulator
MCVVDTNGGDDDELRRRAVTMNAADQGFARRVRALARTRTSSQGEATEALTNVVELLRDMADADLAGFIWLPEVCGSARAGPAVVTEDEERVCEVFTSALQGPDHRAVIDFARLPEAAFSSFLPLGESFRARLQDSAYYRHTFAPLGWIDNLRLVVVDDGHVLAWLGAVRRIGQRPFAKSDSAAVAPLVDPSIRIIRDAARVIRERHPADEGEIVCRSSGDVVGASEGGHRWLALDDVADAIRASVIATHRGLPAPAPPALVDVRLTRLRGELITDEMVLVHVGRAKLRPPSRDARLSDAERRVALLAARGETISTIAKALRRSPETVRNQLKASYRKLGVRSRVELSRIVEVDSEPFGSRSQV